MTDKHEERKMRKLCLGFLTAMEAAPAELVTLAAQNDCRLITVLLRPGAPHDIVGDQEARRETLRRCKDLGVAVDMIEGFELNPGTDVRAFAPLLATGQALGAKIANVVLRGDDLGEMADLAGQLAALAGGHGQSLCFEFSRRMSIKTLPEAAAFLTRLNAGDARILIDSLHFFRNGGAVADIAPHKTLIGRTQISDGPASMPLDNQRHEAYAERLPAGEGAFPLRDFMAALPRDIVVEAEVPMQSLADRGVPVDERVRRVLAATARLIAEAP
jgi:sugar phosphate isomerase/epimerase